VFVSFVYVSGQMRGVGVVFSRFLEVDINVGVIIGVAIVFIYATLGGMKGITWTQVAQYWVLITAFLIPAIAISIRLTGQPLPQLGMGSPLLDSVHEGAAGGVYLLDKLNQINADLGFSSYTAAFADPKWTKLNVFCTALALMVGTAGLPHVIVRFYTVKTVRAARWSAFWALFFIALLYLTAPATASFARYYMINSLQGKTAAEMPSWFTNWEKTGLILWLDDGDGRLRYSNDETNEVFRSGPLTGAEIRSLSTQHQQFLDKTGGADARIELRRRGLSGPDNDIIVLATPEMANLADWIIALVAAGGLAAALSTASGLLLVISSSVAHDLYFRVINPQAPEARRLLVGRGVIGLAVVVAGILGIYPPGFVGEVVAFAFGLAASSFFPAIVLGIFVKRLGTIPAVLGMIAGISFTAYYIVGTRFFGMSPWFFGVTGQGIGTIGMLLNFVVTLGLMPLCKPPTAATQAMIDAIREPEGVGAAVDIEAAIDH
jgi:cation/acetate symporter